MRDARSNGQQAGSGREVATLAGGCFWCLEAVFDQVKGVESVVSGYTGGRVANPTYQQVCGGKTGHAEAVQVTFDPGTISYNDLLEIFFAIHDPTTKDRQGADVGEQYRSTIFYGNPEQEKAARAVIAGLSDQGLWAGPIVTELQPLGGVLSGRGVPQGLLPSQPGLGVLPGRDQPEARQVSPALRGAAQAVTGGTVIMEAGRVG